MKVNLLTIVTFHNKYLHDLISSLKSALIFRDSLIYYEEKNSKGL